MKDPVSDAIHFNAGIGKRNGQEGFTLTEFLITASIMLAVTVFVFSLLAEIQRTASYQAEVQSVLNNTSIAMQTVERCIRQAGNDPLGSGLSGISIVSATELNVRSDLTGSAGAVDPDKGDPDGDIEDSGENITIRYNANSRSLELVPKGGPPQIVAGYISEISFRYYDAYGCETLKDRDVRKVAVVISGSTLLSNPQTHQIFGIKLSRGIRILT
jgi:type II secretory pathway component PulJ